MKKKKAEPKAAVNAAVKVVPEKKVDAAVPAKEAVEVAEAKKGEDVVLNQTYGQAEVKVGNTTICPVMGSKFKVKDDTQFVTVKGKKVFICCAGCKEPLETDPDKYLKK